MKSIEFIRIKATKNSISNRKRVIGIGVNDSDYITTPKINGKQSICPHYRKWINMIIRCYDKEYLKNHPAYLGCTVHVDWLKFSSFLLWSEKYFFDGCELDKDIKIKGNKIYSSDACLFVPAEVNRLLNDNKAKRGDYPIGVSFYGAGGKFESYLRIDGVKNHLGRFITVKEAAEAYRKAKNLEILRKSKKYPYLSKYLINHLIKR